jgi:porin
MLPANTRSWLGHGWCGVLSGASFIVWCVGVAFGQGAEELHAGAGEGVAAEFVAAPPRHPAGHDATHKQSPPAGDDQQVAEGEDGEAAGGDWFGGAPWWEWNHLTGNWGGVRDRLEARGVLIEASYTWEWSSVWRGGVRRKASDRHLFDVNAAIDLERLVGWRGAAIHADFYTTEVSGGSVDAGDIQNISNIDTGDDRTQLGELWFEQRLFEDRLRVKVGKIDANAEFAFPEAGVDFLHTSAAMSPTIYGMTTYPDPATGVVVFVSPVEWFQLGVGIFDGATEDGYPTGSRGPSTFFSDSRSSSWFLIAEAGVSWDCSKEENGGLGRGRFAVGVHRHTAELERFDGETASGLNGIYAVCEQQVWKNAPGEDHADNGLWAIAQAGLCEGHSSDVESHLALGLVLRGTFSGRDDDSAGVYVSYAGLSDAAGSPYQRDETAVELMYKAQITPWLSVTPDLQVIFNPSGDGDLGTTFVGAVRIVLTF